jgi:hypothetical protein
VGKVVWYRERVGDALNTEANAIIARNHRLVSAVLIEARYREFHRHRVR